jgi:hypothetical protein
MFVVDSKRILKRFSALTAADRGVVVVVTGRLCPHAAEGGGKIATHTYRPVLVEGFF